MTAEELARLFRAKRIARGSWRAVCPAHGGKHSGPLSIKEGKKCILIHCFGGCEKERVLAMIGLNLNALFPDGKRDREAERLAEKMRAEAELKRKAERRLEREKIDLMWKWDQVRNALGLLLIQQPDSDKLAMLFNHACNMTRDLPSTGPSCDSLAIQPGEVFPVQKPLQGVSARLFGAQIAKHLRLP